MDWMESTLEAWRVNHAITLELLSLCPDESFDLKPGKGKTIRSNFVHIAGVRKMWIREKLPAEYGAVPPLDWKTASREQILNCLQITNDSMARVLVRVNERQGQNKDTPVMFLAHCLAHEAHHRSQIELTLRIGGVEIDDNLLYGLWNWNR